MKYLVISLIFFSNNLFSQQIYLGMPVNNVTLNSEDIIIIEEIEGIHGDYRMGIGL